MVCETVELHNRHRPVNGILFLFGTTYLLKIKTKWLKLVRICNYIVTAQKTINGAKLHL